MLSTDRRGLDILRVSCRLGITVGAQCSLDVDAVLHRLVGVVLVDSER